MLLVLGLGARLPNLDTLSFYSDEETTALAARSFAEEGVARMPSGMEYRRALPYTWLNAAIARRMGTDREEAYRVGGAVIGGVTPAFLFLVGASFVGAGPAFVAGSLLAVSEWHVVFSRMARMYAPFALFYLLAAAAIWAWATTGGTRFAWLAAAALVGTISLHALGIFVVLFFLLPLAFPKVAVVPAPRLIGTATAVGAASWAFDRFYVQAPYLAWPLPEATERLAPSVPPVIPTVQSPLVIAPLLLVGAVFGVHVFRRMAETHPRPVLKRGPDIALAAAAAGTLVALLLGQLAAAASAALVGLLIGPRAFLALVARERRWVVAGIAVGIAWAVWMVATLGPAAGVRAVAYFPYPYALTLLGQQPAVMLLAAGAAVIALFGGRDRVPVRAIALAVLIPLLATGMVSRWGPPRYFFHLYPLILLLAGVGLFRSFEWLAARARLLRARPGPVALVAASVLAVSGILGEHGLPQTSRVISLEHGEPVDPALHTRSFRPDHAAPARFVREHASAEDVIIAVDVIEQAWYIGRVDYFLRGEGDAASFLYADDGILREIYAGARLLRSREELDRLVADAGSRRVWLTTSGEIEPDDEIAFNEDQRALLVGLEASGEEVFTGRDGITKVFCLNCSGTPTP